MLTNRIFNLFVPYSIIISYDMILLSVFAWVTLSYGHLILFYHHHLPRLTDPIRLQRAEVEPTWHTH